MQVNNINGLENRNNICFSAELTLKHILSVKDSLKTLNNKVHKYSEQKGILTDEFVQNYTQRVNKLGKNTDSVEITVRPNYYGDYVMDVKVLRNNEEYNRAQGLLLCSDIKESLPDFLESEFKWLVSWFKDKNGTENKTILH